jgi:hydrogenase-4 membrane subunit HyfE
MDNELLDQVATLLAYLLVVLALVISAARTLMSMVRVYRVQSWVLTAIVIITAFEPDRRRLALGLLAALPAILAILVPPLLARASLRSDQLVPDPGQLDRRGRFTQFWKGPKRAELIWLQHGHSRVPTGVSTAIDLFLIAAAVLVSFRLAHGTKIALDINVAPSLAVALALLLQGLFTMTNKNDIISQTIGLLVIEHGLFLAAVRIAPAALSSLFVLSLFFYLWVTLTILVWILPELHRLSQSIEVSDNQLLNG